MEIDVRRARPAVAKRRRGARRRRRSPRQGALRARADRGGAPATALPSRPLAGRLRPDPRPLDPLSGLPHRRPRRLDDRDSRCPTSASSSFVHSSVAAEAGHLFGEIRVGKIGDPLGRRRPRRHEDPRRSPRRRLRPRDPDLGDPRSPDLPRDAAAHAGRRRGREGKLRASRRPQGRRPALASRRRLQRDDVAPRGERRRAGREGGPRARARGRARPAAAPPPPADFACAGFEIAVDFHPAAAIGGDFYDLVAESPGTLTVVLADVSGHGLPTGIVMASAKASLTALARSGRKGAELLSELDAEIAEDDREPDVRDDGLSPVPSRRGSGRVHERRPSLPVPRRAGRRGHLARRTPRALSGSSSPPPSGPSRRRSRPATSGS